MFPPASVQLHKNMQFYSCDADKVPAAISEWFFLLLYDKYCNAIIIELFFSDAAMNNNEKVSNLSIAYGKQTWITLLSEKLKNNVTIPDNVKQYWF